MYLAERFWTSVIYVFSFISFSPFDGHGGVDQAPLPPSATKHPVKQPRGPIFKPPGGRLKGPGSDILCDYSQMPGFSNCSTPLNRGCWLRNDKTGVEYNITTNYEDTNWTPIGIHRTYYLNITDDWINADGLNFTQGKFFNNSYPGPLIQGCWGDNITVVVTNKLDFNGTSVHWHGIRQWLTMHMDGVNGVTQCPIAPGDSFNYTFRAMQYGSSWYHSHYSVQYADGAIGPLTLHGPAIYPYDEPKDPILMTDWGHNSAFQIVQTFDFGNKSILLNGIGNITRYNNNVTAQLPIPRPYSITFDKPTTRPKRYLLRIINTSFESQFIFSIDNHILTVIEADFVPITPYRTTDVLVGIGQRYEVVVEANPQAPIPVDGNFWIRTYQADCFGFNQGKASKFYEQTGILRYDPSSTNNPSSQPWPLSTACSDEPYNSLVPILPWTVGKAANDPFGNVGENFTVQSQDGPTFFNLAFFSIGGNTYRPLRIDYSDPTFLNLDNPAVTNSNPNTNDWNPQWAVFPENYTSTDWVYLVIKGSGTAFGAHPIHLHGHDFAILQQIGNATFPAGLNLKRNNPPRRDVVLLPNDGYVVIAFKTDNPGAWLIHCHIAFHAAAGLAMQVMERQADARAIWPSLAQSPALQRAQKLCDNWNIWWGNCRNWWPGDGSACVGGSNYAAPDSGI